MTRFQKDALREVQALPGISSVRLIPAGKHDKLQVEFVVGRRATYPISHSPSDCHAIDQVVRLVKREQLR